MSFRKQAVPLKTGSQTEVAKLTLHNSSLCDLEKAGHIPVRYLLFLGLEQLPPLA